LTAPHHIRISGDPLCRAERLVPPEQSRIYRCDEIEELAEDHAVGRNVSFFPTFAAHAAAGG